MALIVNEFITNSAKHGFDGDEAGAIRIEGFSEKDGFRLLCRDDGKGDGDSILRIEAGGGLGSRIIRALASSIGGRKRWSALDPGLQLSRGGRQGLNFERPFALRENIARVN